MTAPNLQPDDKNWQVLYSAADSRWKDLERIGAFLIPVIVLLFVSVVYAVVGYTFIHADSWVPEKLTRLTFALYIARVIVSIVVPLAAASIGLYFIFKHAASFMRSLYQPKEDAKVGPLIQRKLLGVAPVPPPLDIMFKYPFVLIREVTSLPETHWARWFGGPATLVIYDGVAVYLERGNKFSRVVGPGLPMPFLEQNERIREVVDLRPQTKSGDVNPWTKDGIQIQLSIRVECQIDAGPDALQSMKFRYPFDPLAVKAAVERMTVKTNAQGDLYEASWLEGAWGTITGAINAYVAGHSLDELFFAAPMNRSANGFTREVEAPEEIEQILSRRMKEQLEKTQAGLAVNGVKVLSIQITSVDVPSEVREFREKYWKSDRERIAAVRNSRAEADRIRIRELAHAEAQRTMLNTITQRLERVNPNNLTEPLILSLSGILDQGLDDPIVKPLIAKESFAVLERVRRMLNEGF